MHGVTGQPPGAATDTSRLANSRTMLFLLVLMTGVAPIDRRLIDVAMLSPTELKWLNDYHTRVNREVRGHLDDTATKLWLDEATAAMLVL